MLDRMKDVHDCHVEILEWLYNLQFGTTIKNKNMMQTLFIKKRGALDVR